MTNELNLMTSCRWGSLPDLTGNVEKPGSLRAIDDGRQNDPFQPFRTSFIPFENNRVHVVYYFFNLVMENNQM